ncbi:hypothetical protein ACO3VM_03165 [Methanocaldococcus sp. 10A]
MEVTRVLIINLMRKLTDEQMDYLKPSNLFCIKIMECCQLSNYTRQYKD